MSGGQARRAPPRGSAGVHPAGERGREWGAFAFRGGGADVLGADQRGEFFDGAEFHELETDREGVDRERLGGDGHAEFIAGAERALVVGLAAGDGDDDAGGAEQVVEVEAGGGERLLVGFMADREGAGEEDDPGRVGIGEPDGAVVGEGHDDIFGLRFSNFDFIRTHDQE